VKWKKPDHCAFSLVFLTIVVRMATSLVALFEQVLDVCLRDDLVGGEQA
jgi:hypothetical protein